MTQAAKPAVDLDTLCINTIRFLAVDAVELADSGHPGMPLGAAPMAYVLWTRFLRFNPQNPRWADRDRFVLSAGHGSALLYSLLHLSGYAITRDDLKNFRQWGGHTAGHPERSLDHGIEVTTGPLGQGFANAVGMAIAERHLAARFNRPGFPVVDHRTFVLASDGDIMEGIAAEAASLAGNLKLGRLICLYDANQISLSASTQITFNEDVGKRFEAYGWQVQHVDDGNEPAALEKAISKAVENDTRPSLLIIRTHIGFGSPNKQDNFEVHGSPLGKDEVLATKENLGWPTEPTFHVPDEAAKHFEKCRQRGAQCEHEWNEQLDRYGREHPELRARWDEFMARRLPDKWDADVPAFGADEKPLATRSAGQKVLAGLAKRVTNLIGGSGDLDPSTKTVIKGGGSFQGSGTGDESVQGSPGGPWNYAGVNISFGVREHAMAGCVNGIAAHGGLIPYCSTFLVFSDYMRPSMRLAALAELGSIFVFTHDSVMLGEDGPTHQPIEHLASLRAMPNMIVIRPADANETAFAWRVAVQRSDGPVTLVFTRQNLPVVDRKKYAAAAGLLKGAYVLTDAEGGKPELILVATGSEVWPALQAAEALGADGRRVRVVSMPSWELFEQQSEAYRQQVLPPAVAARITIEAASTFGWQRYAGPQGLTLGIDRFGASAPGEVNQEKFGFTSERIVAAARELLG